MARNAWIETVAEAQRRAKRRLPAGVYSALLAGSEEGVSYRDNVTAFGQLGFAPLTAGQPATRELATRVMGQQIAFPALISPTGVQAVDPAGEVAVARAAAAAGTAVGLSSFASKPVEDVVAANPATFFQTYWMGSRDFLLAGLDRARTAGATGLILTLDWSFCYGRDWGSPAIPERLTVVAMARQAPGVAVRPGYLARWASAHTLPDLTTPNLAVPGRPAPTFFEAYGQWLGTPPPTWDDVAWLRSQWDGPFMVKGICRVDEAQRAVDAGASAISVSNHGGNNIDGTPAPIRVLPSIAEAVGSQVEVLLDGGIRRGSDIVKAVALGARAVMLGRAVLWGLAANGEAGVSNVLEILRRGMDSTMYGLGVASVDELTPEHVLIPDGFTRSLGTGGTAHRPPADADAAAVGAAAWSAPGR